MRSKLAEELRRETDEAVRSKSPEERVALAHSLGDEAIALFAAARGISRSEAQRLLKQEKRRGRRRSRCLEELDGEPAR